MNSFVELESPSPKLDMKDIGLARAKAILTENQTLRWNRQGEVRAVPRHVLENLIRCYEDGQRALAGQRLADILEHAHCIYWEQTAPLADMEVLLDPVPGVTHAPGGSGGEDSPTQ